MLLLSCKGTRKHQVQCSGGGGRLDNPCSSPPGMQRHVHTPEESGGTAHGPADTPVWNSKAPSNLQLSGNSRDYSSSQFTFQVVDSTQNKNTKRPQIAHTVTHILSQLNTSNLRYARSIHKFDWHYFNKDLGKNIRTTGQLLYLYVPVISSAHLDYCLCLWVYSNNIHMTTFP